MDGAILVDKPQGITSAEVIRRLKRTFRLAKVGHAGTLDPLDTGLLTICTGKQTKQIESYQAQKKEYITTIKLGATTPSFDLETEEGNTFPYEHITESDIRSALNDMLGEQDQMPPMFSAKKVNGRRAYEAARKGEEVELKPKSIVIHEIELLECNLPHFKIRISCSKGTYIRSIARDLGKALNSGGYLTELRRTKIGDFSVEKAMNISDFENIIKNL